MRAKLLQLCSILRDPMDHDLPSSSAHGLLQARIPEPFVVLSARGYAELNTRL